jgi:hypothetical protein
MDPATKISGNCLNALPVPPPPRSAARSAQLTPFGSSTIAYARSMPTATGVTCDADASSSFTISGTRVKGEPTRSRPSSLTLPSRGDFRHRLGTRRRVPCFSSTRRCWRPSCRGWMALNRRRLPAMGAGEKACACCTRMGVAAGLRRRQAIGRPPPHSWTPTPRRSP